jgi:hypothetical protein
VRSLQIQHRGKLPFAHPFCRTPRREQLRKTTTNQGQRCPVLRGTNR